MIDETIDRDALLRVFIAEAEENLAVMEESLVALERSPGDGELIAAIFRAAHTLKGNCASVGLDTVVELAHVSEDLLHELREKRFGVTGELITLLLGAADALKTLIPQALADPAHPPAAAPALVEALRQARATGSAGPAQGGAIADLAPQAAKANTVRVDVRKLDLLLNAMSELTIDRGRIRALYATAETRPAEADDALDHLDQLSDRIQDLVLQTRMVPIGPVLRQQVRTARDLATREGKLVHVEISGEDVELDTSVVERLRDPLTHMIRNAIDHGVEPAEVREAQGKDGRATIGLRAGHREGMIVVEVSDDGAGMDPAKLRERARAMQLGDSAETLDERALLRLIFLPGFTTTSNVTAVSGRGIGLDVVEKNVSAVGGSIAVDSQSGKGTRFTIRLPLTVAVLRGLCARVGGELYIVPLAAVTECLDMPDEALGTTGRAGVVRLRGEPLPFLRLREWFRTPGSAAEREKLIVVEYDRKRAALAVDELIGEARAVVKPMSRLFRRSPWISGSALLGSGDIGLVLEVASILDDVAAHRLAGETAAKEMR